MRLMRYVVIVLVMLGFSKEVLATTIIDCNKCTTQSMANKARYSGENGEVYIANVDDDILKKYFVNTESEGYLVIRIATEIPVEQDLERKFKAVTNAKYELAKASRYIGAVPSSVASSAYDLSGATYKQNAVASWYVNNQLANTYY